MKRVSDKRSRRDSYHIMLYGSWIYNYRCS